MAGREVVSTVTLGGKGSTLSSSSVYAIANNLSKVKIDSSILEKLTSNTHTLSSKEPQIPDPPNPSESLTTEVSRASLVVLLNKLLITQTGIRPDLPLLISKTLNQGRSLESLDLDSTFGFLESFLKLNGTTLEETGVTDGELVVLDNCFATLIGFCALLDCSSSALSTVVDAIAALSCEASGADVSMVQSLSDSGDGLSIKDETAVAGDMKVLLAGSKLVGRVQSDAISEIPKVNGSFREQVRLVHSRTRVELNSSVKVGKAGTGKALVTAFSSLSTSLFFMAENSLFRARLTGESIQDDADVRSRVLEVFESNCQSLRDGFKLAKDAAFEANYIRFLLEIYKLIVRVREILAWEGALALLLLERSESKEKNQNKKKVVLGKGTTVIKQLIKDRLQNKELIKDRLQNKDGESVDDFTVLNDWIRDLSLFFEPKDPKLDAFLGKLKEIVESNESRRLPKLPKGTRDFSKEQMASREKAFSTIQEVFKRHGAMALDTPVFEMRETLMGKYGEDSKLIYDLADQGGELCSLRYDLTVPFARYLAMNGISSFKRYQMAKVYRRDNPSRGRFREFYQCDFDIAGQHEAMGPDFEVVRVLTELLDELNINDYQIKLNHRKLLDGMLEICGVSPEKFRTICSSIDKLDKQSFEEIKKEMVEEKGLTVETADRIDTFVKKRGSPFEILSELKQEGSQFLENSGSVLALKDLETLFTALEKSKRINRVVFDLSLARGLDYYTGVIFEAVYTGTAIKEIGSIAAGGRYDNLVGMFGSKDIPAVGASLGIERIFSIIEALEKQCEQVVRATETQVLVSILGNDLSQAAELVSKLWDSKLKAEFMCHKKPLKHFERAEKSLIPLVVMVGEREVNEGVVKIRDYTANKEEVAVPRNKVVEELQRRLKITPQ